MELLISTAQREARIGLAENDTVVVSDQWRASRQLAEDIMPRVRVMLEKQAISFSDIGAIRVHRGPGDGMSGFTTLRIGVITANTLAYALGIPLVVVGGEDLSLVELAVAEAVQAQYVVPVYCGSPNIGSVPT